MKKNNTQKYIVTLIIFVSLFFVSKLSFAQTWTQTQDQIKENTQQIKNIEDKMIDLKDNYRLLYDGAKNQNDQLGHLISYSGYVLAIFGILFAWYINLQYEKIKKMKDTVESTKKYIDEHNKELYKKIKRDETIGLLDRLKEVPEDISNICPLLLSRELLEQDYQYIKESYLKIKDVRYNGVAKNEYVILFIQHFPYQSLKDADLKTEIIAYIDVFLLNHMFDRDIKNLFDQIFKYLREVGINDEQNKTIIKNLFFNYSKSEFKENIGLQNYIKETLTKYQMKTTNLVHVLKEQTPTDTVYIAWVDSIFI